jgi:DHA3 family macrolide efflux protein-like MFS transporter
MIEFFPIQGVLAIDVVTAIFAVGPLLFIAVPQPERKPGSLGEGQPSFWADFRAGFRYVASWPALLMILGMAMVINFLLTPAGSLMPLLVRNHFNGQAFHFAWLESMWGIGVIAGGLLLGVWGGFKNRIYTTLIGLLGIGAGSLLIGLAPAWAYPLALAGMLVFGLSNPITNGPLMAIVQEVVEPEMQGRVFSLIGSAASSMAPLGLALAGPLSDILGVQTWFVVGGIITCLMAVVGYNIPSLVHFEKGRPAQPPVFEDKPVGISISLGD